MNCIILDDDILTQKQLSSFIEKSDLFNLKGCFNNPNDAFETIKSNKIDLIFLDIEMPKMSGLEFLTQPSCDSSIIVISGNRKYALNVFEYDVLDYLVKPIEYIRFLKAVNKYVELKYEKVQSTKSDRLFVRINNKFVRIKFSEILAVQNAFPNITILSKKNSFKLNNNNISFDNFLNNGCFHQLNNDLIVNLKEILKIEENQIEFYNNFVIENLNLNSQTIKSLSQRIKSLHDNA